MSRAETPRVAGSGEKPVLYFSINVATGYGYEIHTGEWAASYRRS